MEKSDWDSLGLINLPGDKSTDQDQILLDAANKRAQEN